MAPGRAVPASSPWLAVFPSYPGEGSQARASIVGAPDHPELEQRHPQLPLALLYLAAH